MLQNGNLNLIGQVPIFRPIDVIPSKNSSSSKSKVVDQLLLDIKALMLLKQSDSSIQKELESAIVRTRDEDVQGFLKLVEPKKVSNRRESFIVALGELVLASFLVIAGLVALAPAAVGFGSPSQLTRYVSDILTFLASKDPSGFLVVLIEFVFSIALILSAFSLLRNAASNLKDAGFSQSPS